ncbi:PIN domain-containing protein [Tenacibaculum finnmarkense]|uniref:PIN domain-containing protein n=1 Tax=Tenacibaculum finnmarkense TaxID=2781243 RepID=UPI00187B8DDD|nr:PIN domain-containing protein [Tenacibaculum finnmarkense]MBE7649181.1 DUF4935 domain-containing protein [Tenacibaculum finnmarkense genomovar ulcerans]MCD8423579.1 PIN domain-containing protein [Tenacibaculum finnmarkense genomovar ulcerans]MCG8239801.1 DUF4935 domain-containing protein [Tenacibaculum finnmarkense genomovar ulcerans]
MKEEIKTHYIFIDTSIFIKENFFAGNKLKAFLKHEKESEIELLTTDITKKECISNLIKFSINSNAVLKKTLKELSNKAKTLKNVESLDEIFNLHNSFEFEKEKEELVNRFNKLKSNHFKNVEIDPSKTLKIIDDYFDFNAPFKDGKKKNEFPDAIVLNSLETWCKENGEKIYVVADDEDLNSFESEYLIPIKEYDKLLDQISFTFGDENITLKIDEIIENKETEIISSVEEVFYGELPSSGFDDSHGYEYDINGVEKFEGFIDSHSILSIFDNTATVELTVSVDYTVDVSYEDTSIGWYDKEDDRWYGTEMVQQSVSNDTVLKVIVEIEFELPGKEIIWKEWEFIEISSGIPTDISIDY